MRITAFGQGVLMDDVEVMIEEGDGVDIAALKQRIARRRVATIFASPALGTALEVGSNSTLQPLTSPVV